ETRLNEEGDENGRSNSAVEEEAGLSEGLLREGEPCKMTQLQGSVFILSDLELDRPTLNILNKRLRFSVFLRNIAYEEVVENIEAVLMNFPTEEAEETRLD
ncbi:hypothetical protein KI387_029447, partial [Taxus chinensis]